MVFHYVATLKGGIQLSHIAVFTLGIYKNRAVLSRGGGGGQEGWLPPKNITSKSISC